MNEKPLDQLDAIAERIAALELKVKQQRSAHWQLIQAATEVIRNLRTPIPPGLAAESQREAVLLKALWALEDALTGVAETANDGKH